MHGYLCRRHYEQLERATEALERLHAFAGLNARAVAATSSASTTAGPRVPLSSLQLDLDALDRLDPGDATHDVGAVVALQWARQVHAAAMRHPLEPRRERLRRVRCGACRQVAVVADAPTWAGGHTTLTCRACGWETTDEEHAEAARYAEALVRDPYRRQGPARRSTGDVDRAAIARLVDALR